MTNDDRPDLTPRTPPQGEESFWSPQPGGTPYASYPGWGQPPQPPQEPRRSQRGRRITLGTTTAVIVAAVVGGSVGGVIAHQVDDDEKTVVSSLSAPPISNTGNDKAPAGSVEQVAGAVVPSVVSIDVAAGSSATGGTGVILSSDGQILTNNHVVEPAANGAGQIVVTFNDGTTASAEILGRDPLTDLAVIKAKDVDDLKPAALGSSGDLKVGEDVVAIGSPLGLSGSVTSGIVSALNRPVQTSDSQPYPQYGGSGQAQQPTVIDAIQTDAAINHGNSGGPLVNMSGQVVGINSAIASGGGSISGDGGNIGIGFAIPIDQARPIVNQLVKGERATHARLGVNVTDATESSGLPNGATISDVTDDSAAAKAGMQDGDVVTKVDDRVIDSADALVAAVRSYRPTDQVTITYLRDGHSRTADVTLESDQ